VLRLASLLWRLRRATTIETGLFDIETEHLSEAGRSHQVSAASREVVRALFRRHKLVSSPDSLPGCGVKVEPSVGPAAELTRCYLGLANLPNFALDRLRDGNPSANMSEALQLERLVDDRNPARGGPNAEGLLPHLPAPITFRPTYPTSSTIWRTRLRTTTSNASKSSASAAAPRAR
jgi:hypothetical protein